MVVICPEFTVLDHFVLKFFTGLAMAVHGIPGDGGRYQDGDGHQQENVRFF
jgi:hypothetical protein